MKNQVLTFIIGVLVGAIIATIGFYIYSKSNTNTKFMAPDGMPDMSSQDGERRMPPDMQNGTGGPGGNMGPRGNKNMSEPQDMTEPSDIINSTPEENAENAM